MKAQSTSPPPGRTPGVVRVMVVPSTLLVTGTSVNVPASSIVAAAAATLPGSTEAAAWTWPTHVLPS